MNRMTRPHNWLILLVYMTTILSSCGEAILTDASPTITPQYVHYIPPNDEHNLRMDFYYPSYWILREVWDSDRITISFGDPRFLTLPTLSPGDIHPTPNDFGSIIIWITPSESNQTSQTELEIRKQNYSKESRMTLLQDYEVVIDGYKANVLEYLDNEPTEGYRALMFNRRILLKVNNQMHEIYFTVAEKDRGGEFEKGYEYFFNSLKIVP